LTILVDNDTVVDIDVDSVDVDGVDGMVDSVSLHINGSSRILTLLFALLR
jgi:hypothetical protein